jgi:hypothetical protein
MFVARIAAQIRMMVLYLNRAAARDDSFIATMSLSLEQHNIEISENRDLWEKKPLLHKVYSEFYREITLRVNPAHPGLIVELGSGMGNIKKHLPHFSHRSSHSTEAWPELRVPLTARSSLIKLIDANIAHLF